MGPASTRAPKGAPPLPRKRERRRLIWLVLLVTPLQAPGGDGGPARELRRAPVWQDLGEGCSPRFAFTATWDPVGERVLVHAGETRRESRFAFLQDLWQFTPRDGAWKRLSTPVNPGGRAYHAAAYDSKRGAVWMFGGAGTDLVARDDLWKLDCESASWSRVESEGAGPGARFSASLVYDPKRDQLLLWGGCKAFFESDNAWPEAWTFDLESLRWTRKKSPAPARWQAAATLSPEADLLIAQGGFDQNSSPRAETWLFDLEKDRWTEATKGPKATEAHCAVWDPLAHKAVFFGGATTGRDGLDALWAFDPEAKKKKQWSVLEASGATPGGRAYHVGLWLPGPDGLWVFGGTENAFDAPLREAHAWQIPLHE